MLLAATEKSAESPDAGGAVPALGRFETLRANPSPIIALQTATQITLRSPA
jgi:hypothetical protein